MKYNSFSYLLGEGFSNIFKNKKSTSASIIIMCATMLIFGVFFVIGQNVNHIVSKIQTQQGMRIFVNDISEEQTKEMETKIKKIQGVNQVSYVSKEDALGEVKQMLEGYEILTLGYEKDNPFPASFVVTLSDLNSSGYVQSEVGKLENILEIQVRDDTINALINISNWIRIVSGVIAVLLIFVSIFIIANTIKLTVHSRRKEISIMKYVGATNQFIRIPFVVEGIVIGIISALLSILVLGGCYNLALQKMVGSKLSERIPVELISFTDMFNILIIVYLFLGIGIGVIGSIISMKKYLKV